MSQANVRSTEAIKQFKIALLTYAEDGRAASVPWRWRFARFAIGWNETSTRTGMPRPTRREKIAEARTGLNRRRLS